MQLLAEINAPLVSDDRVGIQCVQTCLRQLARQGVLETVQMGRYRPAAKKVVTE